jgi:hypothetical protein
MGWVIMGPRPSSESAASVVSVGLLQLRPRVHHKRAMVRDGLADGPALQHQDLGTIRACA